MVLRDLQCRNCGRVQEVFVHTSELRPGVTAESADLARCCDSAYFKRVISVPAIRGETVAKS